MFRQIMMKAGALTTDKAVLLWDGEGELAEGMEVFVEVTDEEGNVNYVSPEDGEYMTEDAKVTVEGGIVKAIEPLAKEEEAPVEEEAPIEEAMVDEPATDPIEEAVDEEKEANVEGRVAALEARLAEMANGLEGLLNTIAALDLRLKEAEDKLAAVEKAPAAEPINDEPFVEEETKTRMSYLRKK